MNNVIAAIDVQGNDGFLYRLSSTGSILGQLHRDSDEMGEVVDEVKPEIMALAHRAMASNWCRYNGQRGTEKQAARVMRQLSVADLFRMLSERGAL